VGSLKPAAGGSTGESVLRRLAFALGVLSLFSLWTFLYHLLRQQGRILLRLDQLNERLPLAGIAPGVADGPQMFPQGISVGDIFPSFRLPDVGGEMVALEDLRGKRVVLVHWGTQCGFCDQIAPELAGLEDDLRKRNTELLLVSSGEAERNRQYAAEHGLRFRTILQPVEEPIEAFRMLGTPVAYLLDEQGKVAAPLAVGANEVPALVREAAAGKKRPVNQRGLEASKIEREGLKAGTLAPEFELPTLDGQPLSLRDYRGRRLLLVFSDPHCGPCDALAPDLARLHREKRDDGPALLMVSRGEPEENRRKAEQYGIDFPLVIQPGWKVSKQYGIFETPVAFLIDRDGVIERNVANGKGEILALAEEGLRAGRGAPVG